VKVIDIHTHGIDGYDTRSSSEDDILKIAEILGSRGVSEIMPTLYSASVKIMRENMMAVKKAMEKQKAGLRVKGPGLKNSKLRTQNSKPSKIIGLHLEGPFLNPLRCGSLDATTFIEPEEYHFEELIEGFKDIVRIVTIAPELKGALLLIKKMSREGIIVSMGHSDATYREAEAGFHAGAKGVTHIFNAMRGFHHREPGIAGFGLLNQEIYIEVIADPFHLHPKILELIFKTKNPERIIIVSDSVKETPSSIPLPSREGGKGWVKAVMDAGGKLLGGSMTTVESSKRLIQMGFDENLIHGCITKNPARYLSR